MLLALSLVGCSQEEQREQVALDTEFQGPLAIMGIDTADLILLSEGEHEVAVGAIGHEDIPSYIDKLENAGYFETDYFYAAGSQCYLLENGEMQICLTSISDLVSFQQGSDIENVDRLRNENLVIEIVLINGDDDFPPEESQGEIPDGEFPHVQAEESQASIASSSPPSPAFGSHSPTLSAEPSLGDNPIAEEHFIDENTQIDDYAIVDSDEERVQVPPGSGHAVSSGPSNDPNPGLIKDAEPHEGTAR